jgi:uncharacterized protein (DUF1697 family)
MVRKGVLSQDVSSRPKMNVALLRGINVGKAKRLAMSDLRTVAEGLGWQSVTTLLATGNLVFTTAGRQDAKGGSRLASALEQALLSHHKLQTRIVVLTCSEVDAVIEEMPFGSEITDPARLMVAAYVDPAVRKKLEALSAQDWSPGALALGRHAAYVWCPDGILDSAVMTAVTKAARDGITARNWSTWQKIQRLAAATSTPAEGQRSRTVFRAG